MQPLVDASLPPAPQYPSYPLPPPESPPVVNSGETQKPTEPEPTPEKEVEDRQIAVAETTQMSPAVAALIDQADRYLAEGRPDKAVLTLERASRIAPKSAEVYCGLARAYYDAGNVSQAKIFAKKSRSLKPSKKVLKQLQAIGL